MNKLLCCVAIFAHALCFDSRAELPLARLHSVFPAGGQCGATCEVKVEGVDLDDAHALLFSTPGISATNKGQIASGGGVFVVQISSNVPPGRYEVRATGRFGSSNPRFFYVGSRTELSGASTNKSLASAQEIPIECTVHALASSASADYYKFRAHKDEHVWIEVSGEPFDSKMRPVLVFYDEDGNEIARERSEGFHVLKPKSGGFYYIKVHDLAFRGGSDFSYRLTLSRAARVQFAFPPARMAGADRPFTAFGWKLPGAAEPAGWTFCGGSMEKIPFAADVPAVPGAITASQAAAPERLASAPFPSFDHAILKDSPPVRLTIASVPAVLEQEPNNAVDQRQKLVPPCEVQGQFHPEGDVDIYELPVRKGQVFWIEVISERLGQPVAPFIVVQKVTTDSQGKAAFTDIQEIYPPDANIGGPVFNTSSRDPVWRLEAGEDATYVLRVRDLFNHKPDPSRLYRLAIRREAPDFALVALIAPPPSFEKDKREAHIWAPLLRQNDCFPIKVIALRRDGFAGPINLQIEGGPAGLAAAPCIIPEGQDSAWLTLTTTDKTPDWTGSIRILGTATSGPTQISHVAHAATTIWEVPDYNNEAARSRLTSELVVAVRAEPAPFRIEAPAQPVQATANGAISVPLRISRAAEFKEGVKLRAYLDNQSEPVREWDADGQAAETKLELDPKQAKLGAGAHQVLVLAQTKGKIRRVRPDEAAELESSLKAADETTRKKIEEKLRQQDVTAIFAAPLLRLNITPPQTAAK